MGPKFVILKKGEHGAMLFTPDEVCVLPAFPLGHVVDPTGAGDSFAGGLMGALAAEEGTPGAQDQWPARLRRAMAHGTVAASFTVEDFSLKRLQRLNRPQLLERVGTVSPDVVLLTREQTMARLRTFIAIDLGKTIREHCVAVQETLAPRGPRSNGSKRRTCTSRFSSWAKWMPATCRLSARRWPRPAPRSRPSR